MIKRIAIAFSVMAVCGCKTMDLLRDRVALQPPVVIQQPATAAQVAPQQQLWPAYPAPDFLQHGTADENTYRSRKIEECRAAGLDCLAITMRSVPGPELSIHLLLYYSDRETGKTLPSSWYQQGNRAGVTRWQVDIGPVIGQLEAVSDRFQGYPPGVVQFCGIPADRWVAAKSLIGLDDDGVKISPAIIRQAR